MKLKFSYIALFAAFLFTSVTYAQVDRRIAPQQYRQPKSKKEPYDFVEENVKYLKKELKLDDFQAAAVREIMAKEKDGIMELGKDQNLRTIERQEKSQVIIDRISENVKKILTPEQLVKYEEMLAKNKKS